MKRIYGRMVWVVLVLLVACGGSESPPVGGAGIGKVVITGTINKTYTPKEISAVKIGDSVGINVNEETPCGVSLQFPIDLKPGTYPIEDGVHQLTAKVFGDYGTFCGESGGTMSGNTYRSTGGTLTLTSSGKKYEGKFEFEAANLKIPAKTIKVSGSFENASLP